MVKKMEKVEYYQRLCTFQSEMQNQLASIVDNRIIFYSLVFETLLQQKKKKKKQRLSTCGECWKREMPLIWWLVLLVDGFLQQGQDAIVLCLKPLVCNLC